MIQYCFVLQLKVIMVMRNIRFYSSLQFVLFSPKTSDRQQINMYRDLLLLGEIASVITACVAMTAVNQ